MKYIPLNEFLNANKPKISKLQVTNQDIQQMSDALNKTLNDIKSINKSKEDTGAREVPERKKLCDDLIDRAFPHNKINGNKGIDLTIQTQDTNSQDGVIIEYKCPDKTHKNPEMIRPEHPNAKALCEIVQYYLTEITGVLQDGSQINPDTTRITGIVTNMTDWYVISNDELEKYFDTNELKQQYKKWAQGKMRSRKASFFRKSFVKSAIDDAIKNGIKIIHINIDKVLKSKAQIKQFYKFLTPQCLLWENIPSGNNAINPRFYNELLYIMGLKEKGHKIHILKDTKTANYGGTLTRNIIKRLQEHDIELSSAQMQSVAIHLSVLWVNRLLFLKLLEAQLENFNDSKSYQFLTNQKLHNFQDVFDLFFNIMATKRQKRNLDLERFKDIPYLNSSLFDQNADYDEQHYLSIDQLRNTEVPIYKHTILTESNLGDKRKTGTLPLLTYLIDFLSAYDFTTLASQKSGQHSNLINAAVLGLVFEKINGYKDGAYFTPGWICNQMAKETVHRAVLNKINQQMTDWPNYTNLKDVQARILQSSHLIAIEKKISDIIDNLRICDPAVGSGHFLVSVLNEIIALKSVLGVLLIHYKIDGKDKYEPADFQCRIENNDLVVRRHGKPYCYYRNDTDTAHVQRTMFEQKTYIIENCLFGVDLNPNSTQICRLRLWIELLKSAYYYTDPKTNQVKLTTMPNIDINIKTRNSLIHEYYLSDNTNISKHDMETYKKAVREYKQAKTKNRERALKKSIKQIKLKANAGFITPERISAKKDLRKYAEKLNQLQARNTALPLGHTKTDMAKQISILSEDLAHEKYKRAGEELKQARHHHDPFFDNAMEWRIEYPEVWTKSGDYKGFDAVISNPPYVFARDHKLKQAETDYYRDHYDTAKYQLNTYHLFIELAFKILRNHGIFAYIIPNNMLTIQNNQFLRKYLLKNGKRITIINSKDKLFKDASVNNCIVYAEKAPKPCHSDQIILKERVNHQTNKVAGVPHDFFGSADIDDDYEPIFSFERAKHQDLKAVYTLMSHNNTLNDYTDVHIGIKAYQKGKGQGNSKKNKQSKTDVKNRIYHSPKPLDNTYVKYLSGSDVSRYSINWGHKRPNEAWIKYGHNLAEMGQPKYFKGPRILVPQIVRNSAKHSLKAAFIDENNVVNDMNSMIIQPKPDEKCNMYYILGVLNSSIITMWFAMKFDKFQRKIDPQFKVGELKQFPIPKATQKQQAHVERLVKLIMTNIQQSKIKDAKQDDAKIDDCVIKLFGITKQLDIQAIHNFRL